MSKNKRFEEINKGIVEALNLHSNGKLEDLLVDTDPNHYGVEDVSFEGTVWVDIQTKTFTFKNATLSFSARIGGSKDGADISCSPTISGEGKFDFLPNNKFTVTEISTERRISLFPDDED